MYMIFCNFYHVDVNLKQKADSTKDLGEIYILDRTGTVYFKNPVFSSRVLHAYPISFFNLKWKINGWQ